MPDTAAVDGAWWPRSNELTTELPDMLEVLAPRLGPIHRVIYHLDDWPGAPRQFAAAGRRVRLDGYRYAPAHAIDIVDIGGTRIALMVIPAQTSPDSAHAAMTSAADPSTTSTVGDLLAVIVRYDTDNTETAAAQQRWDSEGGGPAR
ncbi:DUF5994 family protein [Nocardia sp. CDC159]|uniref:DUF5994 family protein n=1 Tax=Nocardia pulmonis TaxID=2951408 RepID=A0A9X2EDP1_9NOCA|nr:DUF5994 family protein [Nocardia pulmonis]MCM6791897.1 DUF5994 family protein [Nocardia sp. CDC159]